MRLGEVNCLAGLLAPEQQNAASVGYPTIEHYQYHRKMAIQQYQRNTRTQANNLMEQGRPVKDLRMLRHGREGDELESA